MSRLFSSWPATAAALALLAAPALAETGTRESLRLLDVPELWVLVLVLLPGLALVSWLGYRGERIAPGWRTALTALRFVALAALLVLLFRPVLVQRREEVQKPEVLVLVDESASMRRKDTYGGDAEVRRALSAYAAAGLDASTRGELAARAVQGDLLPLLEQRGYVPRLFGFSSLLSPLTVPYEPGGRGHSTQMGDALLQALGAHRGRHVTEVVLVSDGRQNAGASASEAARVAGSAGVAVHTVVVGDTRPERNAVVELVEAPTNALEGDEIAVVVRVLARGAAGESATLVLEEREGDRLRVVADAQLQFTEGGERVILAAPPGPADANTGERRFRVSLPPLRDETMLDDNTLELAVHVTPEKVRVLYVDGYPRYEYRYVKELLKRADENVQAQIFLLSATPDFIQESTRGLPPLKEVPTGRRELLESYDVVILGDVNPWAVSPDPARAEEFLRSLAEFVERGGGLLLIAGEYDNPRAYVGTALEPLFPVVLDAAEMLSAQPDTTREFRPRLEEPSIPHEIVRLVPDVQLNRKLWEEAGGLHGMRWFLPVHRAKPGAQVLLRHPTERNNYGPYPLLVSGYYPSGRTLFSAFDETWLWRFHYGDRYHERYWRNALRWLALGRLKSGDRRYRIEVAHSSYDLGAPVVVEARVLDEDFRPSEAPVQAVQWSDPDGRRGELQLQHVGGRSGLYRGTLEPARPGLHRLWFEQNGQRISSAEFEVVLPSLENQEPTPDPALMRELALLSGGRAVDLARLTDLWQEFPGGEERREPISSRLEDIWDTWWTLLFVLGVLSVEWVLRKRVELV